MDNYNVLVVEDDREIRDGIGIYLKSQGYGVVKAADGVEGLAALAENEIHLVIADIMMPRMDGIEMVVKLREDHDMPVIMLSAKSEEIDKVTGLNIGADDYVTKPFAPMELLARVRSQLRRYDKYLKAVTEGTKPDEGLLIVGGLELDERAVRVSVDGEEVKLTPTEFRILALLMKNPGRVFSAEEIYEHVWNERAVNTDTIMVHVRNIREKIEINPKDLKYLKVVWGIGYKIDKP